GSPAPCCGASAAALTSPAPVSSAALVAMVGCSPSDTVVLLRSLRTDSRPHRALYRRTRGGREGESCESAQFAWIVTFSMVVASLGGVLPLLSVVAPAAPMLWSRSMPLVMVPNGV